MSCASSRKHFRPAADIAHQHTRVSAQTDADNTAALLIEPTASLYTDSVTHTRA